MAAAAAVVAPRAQPCLSAAAARLLAVLLPIKSAACAEDLAVRGLRLISFLRNAIAAAVAAMAAHTSIRCDCFAYIGLTAD